MAQNVGVGCFASGRPAMGGTVSPGLARAQRSETHGSCRKATFNQAKRHHKPSMVAHNGAPGSPLCSGTRERNSVNSRRDLSIELPPFREVRMGIIFSTLTASNHRPNDPSG